jgi:hypothetical protein
MRAVLEDGAHHPIVASDDVVLEAARDVFEAQRVRQDRRTSPTYARLKGMP